VAVGFGGDTTAGPRATMPPARTPGGGRDVAVGVELRVAEAVFKADTVGVKVGVGVLVAVAVGLNVGVPVGVPEVVDVAVGVGLRVTVDVIVGVLVSVGVSVSVGADVTVGVAMAVAVAVLVAGAWASRPARSRRLSTVRTRRSWSWKQNPVASYCLQPSPCQSSQRSTPY